MKTNHKITLYILTLLLLTISVKGACITPTENLTINSGDYELCSGIYNITNLNLSNQTNINLTCNNTLLIGNSVSGTTNVGIITSQSNISISGCSFKNYYYGIRLSGATKNITIINNSFSNTINSGIFHSSSGNNISIKNNYFINSSIYLNFPITTNIYNNDFYCRDTYNMCGGRTEAIDVIGGRNINIYNNNINGGEWGININTNSTTNINIYRNNITYNDRCIRIIDINPEQKINIFSNKIYNCTNDYDTYDIGIFMLNASLINIYDNNFSTFTKGAIFGMATSNITIYNNSFDQVNIYDKSKERGGTGGAHDKYEPTPAIRFTQLFQGFMYESPQRENHSSNIKIENNTFSNNIITFLWLQGTKNITHDLINYYFRNITFATDFNNFLKVNLSANEFYFNNYYDEVLIYDKTVGVSPYMIFENSTHLSYSQFFNYTISKKTMTFENLQSNTQNILINNLKYPYNDVKNLLTGIILFTDVTGFSAILSSRSYIGVGDYANSLNCSSSESSLWAVLTLLFIAGFLFFAYEGFMNGKPSGFIMLVFMLVLGALIIGNFSLALLKPLC